MSNFNSFANSLRENLQSFSNTVSQKTHELSTNIPTLAQSTQRMVQEKLGQVTDISQLPQEYLELENKVDTIKIVYEHFLQVTAVYENESYDYPKYVSESVNEFSKNMAAKVQELSKATSATEAQNILVAPGPVKEPKTLNYAMSKVALNASEYLNHSFDDPMDAKLSKVLLNYSDVQTKVAQARLQQDTQIQTKFNKVIRENLAESIARANKARKDVQSKRLQYDVARTNLQNAKPEKEAGLRVQMETLEDQFAQATEDATVVMQEVIASANFLPSLKELATAQLEYYEQSAKLMKEFISSVDSSSSDAPAPKTSKTSKTSQTSTTTDAGISLEDDDDEPLPPK
ncbi:hypothetical protein B1J92_L00891g [Nakaseomyces glabratus]|nr:hypothetical protein B1J91_L00891g [Nakaseomyces glabratus]OXB47706.1 hypothetical protein B1J92_L00891g [Nakaseomyces glabratus]